MLFAGQYPDEKIILTARRHKIVLLFKILFIVIFLAGPLILFLTLSQGFLPFLWNYPYSHLLAIGVMVYALFIWLYFILVWADYYLDVWIVTDHRVIDIVQTGLFDREFSEFKLSRVQDVTVEVKGFIPTIFHFGNVRVQTAGEQQSFVFLQVPEPYKIKDEILRAYDDFVKEYREHTH